MPSARFNTSAAAVETNCYVFGGYDGSYLNQIIQFDKGKNGIISIELNTVKDINSKYSKYNLVVSAFSAKDNYVRNTLQKHAERVEYIKKDLSQVNPQLYEWLASVNERSDGSSTTTNSIRDNTKKVNNNVENFGERFSISVDSEGNTIHSIVFSSEQIKLTSNKNPISNNDIRYSISAVDDYTEKQYNDYGWVRVNDVLSVNEYTDFNNKLNNLTAEIRRNRTKDGEYIIAVNDLQGDRFGVNNVLVFAKGTYQNPKITRVIRIDFEDTTYNNETNLTILREYIYEQERQNNEYASIIEDVYPQAIISRYTKEDFSSYQESKIEWRRQGSRIESGRVVADSREVQDGAGDSRSGRGNVRYSISENQNTRDDIHLQKMKVGNIMNRKREDKGNGRERGQEQNIGRIRSGGIVTGSSGRSVRGVVDLQREFGEEAGARIASRVEELFKKSKRLDKYTEELAREHAKKIGYNVQFAKLADPTRIFLQKENIFFVSDDVTFDKFGRILDCLDSVNSKTESGRTVHISVKRWRQDIFLKSFSASTLQNKKYVLYCIKLYFK